MTPQLTPDTAPATLDLFRDGKYIATKLRTDNANRLLYEVRGPRATFYLFPRMREDGTHSCESFFLMRGNGNVLGASIKGNNSFRINPDGSVSFWSEWR